MIHFYTSSDAQPTRGQLRFVGSEHSFSFLPHRELQLTTTSLSLGTLQIEVEVSSGRLLYVWGYHPRASWALASLELPNITTGAVFAADSTLEPGVAFDIDRTGGWQTTHDVTTGWVQVARRDRVVTGRLEAIEFADHIVVELDRDVLNALWLQPRFV